MVALPKDEQHKKGDDKSNDLSGIFPEDINHRLILRGTIKGNNRKHQDGDRIEGTASDDPIISRLHASMVSQLVRDEEYHERTGT